MQKTAFPKNKTIEELKKMPSVWREFVKEIQTISARPINKVKGNDGKIVIVHLNEYFI